MIGTPPRPWSAKSGWSNSAPPESGAPSRLVRPTMFSCSRIGALSHVSICILILRATRYDPPASHSAAGSAPFGTQTCSSIIAVCSPRSPMVPSLNPNRFLAVTWSTLVDDVRPKPSCDHFSTARPNAMRVRLRTAWTATCGSCAQAWMQRSPSESDALRLSATKCGNRSNAAGLRAAIPNRSAPEPSTKSEGPKPNVIVRPEGGRS